MKTKTFSLFGLCLLLGAVMLACGGATDNTATTNSANTTASTTAAGDKIGVPECDDFIAKYEACVNSKVPESARSMVKANLDSMRNAWKQAAATPQGKAGLATGCKQALDQAKTTMGTYGCSW
jgi:hypothetical protein